MNTSPSESEGIADYPSAEHRHAFDRTLNRVMWIIVCVLLAWLVAGFFRDPAASGQERVIVGLFAICFAATVAVTWGVLQEATRARPHSPSSNRQRPRDL